MTHAEIVKRYNVPGKCRVRIADWPYECKAKDANPDHVVYICDEHRVWWHEPDHQNPDVADWGNCDALVNDEPSTASTIPVWVDLTLKCPICGKRADMCFDHGDTWKKRGSRDVG